MYWEVKELLPDDVPKHLGNCVGLTHYVDANIFYDQITGCSVTCILHLSNKTPVDWYYKKHITVDKLTYGYEFVSDCNCVDQIIDLRNTLQYLGLPIH